jgi:hypothetical protein
MTDPVPRCPTCGGGGEFGYRAKQTGELIWYCAAHRLGKFYADARLSSPSSSTGGRTDAQNFERPDPDAAERRAGVSNSADVVARDRADPAVDGAGLAAPANRTAQSLAVSVAVPVNGQPYFDAAGRFVHPCCRCGKPAMLGFGVSLRNSKLGTWYCGDCKPTARLDA